MAQHTYTIQGMDCADCARHVEQGVSQLDGIHSAKVQLVTGLLQVEGETPVQTIRQRVEVLGYRLVEDAPQETQTAKPELLVPGFLRFLWTQTETRLALAGGLLLVVSLALNGTPRAVLQVLALLVAVYPVARSGLSNLWINRSISINLLMTIAAAGAVAIGDLGEAATLIFLFDLAEALEGYTNDRARHVLSGLRDLAPSQALRIDANGETLVAVSALLPGERILVRPGDRIPIDGQVLSGLSEVNQSPITGESIPALKSAGEAVFAGTINGSGGLEIEVTRLAEDTTLARIVRMVTEAQNRQAPSQRFIDRFAQVYTPAVVGIAVLVALVPPLFFGQPFLTTTAGTGWLYRALSLLVIACPCALVISAPVTVISAITSAARQGVLIKGGAYLEALADVRQLAFDKTGTLTRGRPAVQSNRSVDCAHWDTCSEKDLCPACEDVLALASALERRSSHPLASAVVNAAEERGLSGRYLPAENVMQLSGLGLQGQVGGKLATIGSHSLFEEQHPHEVELCEMIDAAENLGQTTMMVCDGDRVRGFIAVADELRPESQRVIAELHRLGIQTAMLTGDNPAAARGVALPLGIDTIRAGLLPEDKVQVVKELMRSSGSLAMVGDGINDTPALAEATLGVAMGGAGSDQAMETADIVLMDGSLTRLPFAVRLARKARFLVRENVVFSLAIKLIFILLALSGSATMWMAVAADMGVSLLVTLNGLRPLAMKE